eukprot:365871-Chlamydomonas_euryale.AAC.6
MAWHALEHCETDDVAGHPMATVRRSTPAMVELNPEDRAQSVASNHQVAVKIKGKPAGGELCSGEKGEGGGPWQNAGWPTRGLLNPAPKRIGRNVAFFVSSRPFAEALSSFRRQRNHRWKQLSCNGSRWVSKI